MNLARVKHIHSTSREDLEDIEAHFDGSLGYLDRWSWFLFSARSNRNNALRMPGIDAISS
jgi:hypothetical protein